jgi:hypothetical protein
MSLPLPMKLRLPLAPHHRRFLVLALALKCPHLVEQVQET